MASKIYSEYDAQKNYTDKEESSICYSYERFASFNSKFVRRRRSKTVIHDVPKEVIAEFFVSRSLSLTITSTFIIDGGPNCSAQV